MWQRHHPNTRQPFYPPVYFPLVECIYSHGISCLRKWKGTMHVVNVNSSLYEAIFTEYLR